MCIERSKKQSENNVMKRIILFLVVMCTLSCSSAWAAGTIISDDFDDGIIDTDIWRNLDDDSIGENFPDRYPVERNGHLEIVNNGTQDDVDGLRTQINLPADGHFRVEVSFNASNCAEQSALFLSVHNATTDYDHAVQFDMIRNGVVEGQR